MASQQEIYKGFWTNWIDGRVQGATLTLSRDGGAYLIAFLALFVHVAGASFWRIVSFVIFYYRAHPDLDDTVVLQQLTVFRNSTSAISSLRGFFKISIRSRDWRKNLPAILWAVINVVGFLAAGILSSRVTSTRSDVLLKPTLCGQWTYSEELQSNRSNFVVEEAIREATLAEIQATSEKYAAVCYNPENSPEGCTTFGRRPPRWKSTLQPGCLWDDLCIDNATFSVDSGYIASDLDLGINSHPSDRISIRNRLECAPIKQHGYTQTYSGTEVLSLFAKHSSLGSAKDLARHAFREDVTNHKFDAFFYGPTLSFWSDQLNTSAATFIFNHGTFADSAGPGLTTTVHLAHMSFELFGDGSVIPGSEFVPIPVLKIPEREVTLLFLSTNAWSSALITDPWFKTDQPFEVDFYIAGAKPKAYTLYKRNPATTVLACAQKYEMCRGTSNESMHCLVTTSEGDPYKPGDPKTLLGLTPRQTIIAHRLRQANIESSLAAIVQGLAASGLLAYEYLGGAFDAPLPNNQWTLEVENWFATSLTIMQAYTTQYVTGLQDERFDKYLVPPAPDAQWMCHNQIVQRRDYASFSVLGICIILVLGGFATGLNMLIVRISGLLLPRSARNKFRESSWDANELLELQVKAFGESINEVDSRSTTSEKVNAHHDEHIGRASSDSD